MRFTDFEMETVNESAENVQEPIKIVIPSTQIHEHADDLKLRLNKLLAEKTLSDITLIAGLDGAKWDISINCLFLVI